MKDFLSNDLSFQDRIMQLIEISSPWSWYIYLKNINTSFWLFLQTYICQNRQYQFFMSIRRNWNLKQQCNKVKKNYWLGDPMYNTLGFKYMDIIQLTPFSSFSIYKKVSFAHIIDEWNLTFRWHAKNLLFFHW